MSDTLEDDAPDASPELTSEDLQAAYAAAAEPPPEPDVWLRIEKGLVTNAETYHDTPPDLPGVTWKRDTNAGIGWRYGSSGFKPPPKT